MITSSVKIQWIDVSAYIADGTEEEKAYVSILLSCMDDSEGRNRSFSFMLAKIDDAISESDNQDIKKGLMYLTI